MRTFRIASLVISFFCVNAGLLKAAEQKPNVLLICIDDLRPELACYGVSYIHSPNIDKLAAKSRVFTRHYVQAPTCGASRYTLLTGRYGGASNGAIFARAGAIKKNPNGVPPSMPGWFKQHEYTTVSVGKVSHHPGGRGGKDWDDEQQPEMPFSWTRHLMPTGAWQHPRGAMHGLANGEIRKNAKDMDVFQSTEGPDSIYPDGLTIDESLKQMDLLARDGTPFFLAVGILRPHLPFGAPAKYMEPYKNAKLPPTPHPSKPTGKTTWHGSGEFMKYNRWKRNPNDDAEFAIEVRKHYAACVTYADAQVGRLLEKLQKIGKAENTIVVLWGDHGWHLGEHAIWGKHALFEESLRSPLIIHSPKMKRQGESTSAIVETLDIFPTLCELVKLPKPEKIHGESLVPQLVNPEVKGRFAISYRSSARTIRTDKYRLISHKKGELELYDHTSKEGETANLAEKQSDVAKSLLEQLDSRMEQAE